MEKYITHVPEAYGSSAPPPPLENQHIIPSDTPVVLVNNGTPLCAYVLLWTKELTNNHSPSGS
jgi:hypothetical protein